MGNRLTKIYTRTGDKGTTGLGDGSRVDKSALRVEAMGDVDELNSLVGLLLTEKLVDGVGEALVDIQHVLFNVGGELSIPGSNMIMAAYVNQLEKTIDNFNNDLPPLKEFILPGGNKAAAVCHLCRTVCRRAERKLTHLAQDEAVNESSLAYINRLSDLLFVFCRVLARAEGKTEVYWDKNRLSN